MDRTIQRGVIREAAAQPYEFDLDRTYRIKCYRTRPDGSEHSWTRRDKFTLAEARALLDEIEETDYRGLKRVPVRITRASRDVLHVMFADRSCLTMVVSTVEGK